jgi:hypothetical protein
VHAFFARAATLIADCHLFPRGNDGADWRRPRSLARLGAHCGQGRPSMPHHSEIHRWYCTASWARRRAHQLHIEPLCSLCLEAGRVTPATVADHTTPRSGSASSAMPRAT